MLSFPTAAKPLQPQRRLQSKPIGLPGQHRLHSGRQTYVNALQLPKLAKYAVCSGNMQNLRNASGSTLRAQRAKHRKLRSKRLNWMPAQKRTPLKKLPKKPNVTCVTPAEKLGAIDQALKAWAAKADFSTTGASYPQRNRTTSRGGSGISIKIKPLRR